MPSRGHGTACRRPIAATRSSRRRRRTAGPTLAAMLNILEGYDLAGHAAQFARLYLSRVSMAMKEAFADRNRQLGDPNFVKVPLEQMLSDERAAHWRKGDRRAASRSTRRAFSRAREHDTGDGRRQERQLRVADAFAWLVIGRHHSGIGLHVQQLDDQFSSRMPGTPTASPRAKDARQA